MKKSVVALAVLSAFTGLASAQSSVTLYGRLDQNVTQVDPGSMGKAGNSSSTNAGSSVTKLNDGSVNGLGASRFGMRGVEDMGDGVKAYFKLESGISVDSGVDGGATQTSTTSMFNREAYVGLGSTTWGDIRFGRLETLSREVNRLINDASGENQLNIAEVMDVTTPAGGTYKQNRVYFNNFGTRVDNAISYRSPSFMGMAQMVATYGLSEGAKAPDGNSQAAFGSTNTLIKANIASYTGIGIILTAGPLAADLVYEQLNGGGQSGGSFGKTATMGLSYDLEFAKFYVAYQDGTDVTQAFGQNAETVFTAATGSANHPSGHVSGVDLTASNFGVKVPFGQWTFVAQYTQSELYGNTGALNDSAWASKSLKQDKYGLSAEYAFSKRTSVYGVIIGRSGDQDQYFNRKSEYALGLAHTF